MKNLFFLRSHKNSFFAFVAKNYFLVIAFFVGSLTICQAQDMEVTGTMKVKQMPVDNTQENLVVKKDDGTLASRTLASLVGNNSGSDSTRSLQTDLEIVKLACSCDGNLPPFAVQRLLDAGYTEGDLLKSGISATEISLTKPVFDGDGNEYDWVLKYNGQYAALIKNIRTTKYMDGTPIPYAGTAAQWAAAAANQTPAYCWPNGNIANGEEYGALYNLYALNYTTNGNKEVCPYGYIINSNINSPFYFRKPLGLEYWDAPNVNAGASESLQITGSGKRDINGAFSGFRQIGGYWSISPSTSSPNGTLHVITKDIVFPLVYSTTANPTDVKAGEGYSLRCVRQVLN